MKRRRTAQQQSLFSRRHPRPSFANSSALSNRGRREGRASAEARGPRAKKMHGAGTTGTAGTTLGLKRSSQHSWIWRVAMTIRRKRSTRAPLGSLGRPSVAGWAEQELFWQGIATGLSIEAAALKAGVSEAIGSRLFRKAGGMSPAMFRSSTKPLSGRYLSLAEREEIALLNAQGHSMREIGRRLGRAGSTISRELDRNAATHGGKMAYRATAAQWHADRSARRPKPTKLARNAALRTYAEDRLAGVVAAPSCARVRRSGRGKDRRWAKAWSPEQIAQRLPIDFPDDETMRISHEAVYQALFIQGRGALRRELATCLRTGRALRVPRARAGKRSKGFVS